MAFCKDIFPLPITISLSAAFHSHLANSPELSDLLVNVNSWQTFPTYRQDLISTLSVLLATCVLHSTYLDWNKM